MAAGFHKYSYWQHYTRSLQIIGSVEFSIFYTQITKYKCKINRISKDSAATCCATAKYKTKQKCFHYIWLLHPQAFAAAWAGNERREGGKHCTCMHKLRPHTHNLCVQLLHFWEVWLPPSLAMHPREVGNKAMPFVTASCTCLVKG